MSSAVICTWFVSCFCIAVLALDSCDIENKECVSSNQKPFVSRMRSSKLSKRYLLYDVNPGEGFNLRRDVYMRVASLVKKVNEESTSKWILVLPPWGPLYHWKSRDIGYQGQIPWSKFFDLDSLSKYVPVMEFHSFLSEVGYVIDEVYYLQHYAEGWKDGHWEERMDLTECNEPPLYEKLEDGKFYGWFWGYEQTYATDFHCLSIQGTSSTLKPLLLNSDAQTIMIDRSEVILHDIFGDVDYWQVRRSMRFAQKFNYTGCGGNSNNFQTLEECLSKCKGIQAASPKENTDGAQKNKIHSFLIIAAFIIVFSIF